MKNNLIVHSHCPKQTNEPAIHTCTLLSNFKYKGRVYFEPGSPFNSLKRAVVKGARLEARGRRRCPNLNIASGWDYLSSRSLPFSLHYRLPNGSNRNQAFGPGAYTWPQLTDKRCSISFCSPPPLPSTLYSPLLFQKPGKRLTLKCQWNLIPSRFDTENKWNISKKHCLKQQRPKAGDGLLFFHFDLS